MDDTERRRRIQTFSFDKYRRGNQGFKRLCIQFFGYMGHGKSSFINTCKCVWNNTHYMNHIYARDTYGGHTMHRLTYSLTENITLVDNRGCSKMNSYETGEIFAQLGNLLQLDKPVVWSRGFGLADRIVEAESCVKPSDFITPIFVYSVTKTMIPGEQDELRKLLHTARNLTGINPIVVLTYKKQGHLAAIEKVFRDVGTDHFFPIENYTPQNYVKTSETHESVIQFLYEVIKDVEFRVEQPRDPVQEMIVRKLFVLNYVHNRELDTHKNNLEGQIKLENTWLNQEIKFKQQKEEKRRQREKEKHEEEMRSLQREFERQRLWDQFEHEQRLKDISKAANRKGAKNKNKK